MISISFYSNYLNNTILECKFDFSKLQVFIGTDLNNTILECKYLLSQYLPCPFFSFEYPQIGM